MLDKSRPIYFAMDHTSSKDNTICNNIVNQLSQQGFTVKKHTIGPNAMYQNMKYLYDNGIKNAIMFHLFNGVDPSNIKEVAKNGSDNRGKKVRQNGNDVVLAWFYDACDCTREDGNCYSSVRGSETHGSRFYNPKQYMDNNDIYYINQSSDNGRHKDRADYTGDKIVTAFVALFDNNTSSGTEEAVVNSESTKTIKSVVVEKTYSTPNYNKTYSAKTDENGAFQNHLNLNIAGRYIVRLHYAGDLKNATSTRSIEIDNQQGQVVQQKLLETKTTFNYSDNTEETLIDGNAGDYTDTITVIETTQYQNGEPGETTTVTRDNNKIDFTFVKQVTGNNDAKKANPFETVVNSQNVSQWIGRMQVGNAPFELIDNSKTYEITLEQFKEVYNRDSKTMQIMGKLSQYTAFRVSTDTEKYIVLTRGMWNAILESIYYYMVEHKGTVEWPNKFIFDIQNNLTKIGSENIYWKDNNIRYYWVRDKQDTGYTCGPTACSVATQVLCKYYSEQNLQKSICASSRYGSGASTHKDKLIDKGFSAEINTDINKAVEWLKAGKPTTWHVTGHYITLTSITSDEQILVINSSTNSGLATGWHSKSTVNSSKYKKFPQSVLIGLNWNISETEKTQFENFYNSMGGGWTPGDNTSEEIRFAEIGASYPVKWKNISFWTYKRYSTTTGTLVDPTLVNNEINMGSGNLVILSKKIPVNKTRSSIFFDVRNSVGTSRVMLGSYSESNDTYNRGYGLNFLLGNITGNGGTKKTVELRFENNKCTAYVNGSKTSQVYDYGTSNPDMYLMFYTGTANRLYISNIIYKE